MPPSPPKKTSSSKKESKSTRSTDSAATSPFAVKGATEEKPAAGRKMGDVLEAAKKEPLYKQQQKLYERCKDYPMGTPQEMLNPGLIGASIMGSKGQLHILGGAEVEAAKELFSEETRASLDELGPQKSIYLLSLFKQYESMRVSTSLISAAQEDKARGGNLTEAELKLKLSKQCATDFSAKINRELDLTKQLHERFTKVDVENRRIRLIAMILVFIVVMGTAGFIMWITAEPDRTRQVVMWTNYYLHRLSGKFSGKGDMTGGRVPSYPDLSGFQRPTDDTPPVAMRGGQPFGIYDDQ